MNQTSYLHEQDTPAIPLPNPGEGGPVSPGNGSGSPSVPNPSPDSESTPMIPLPNPGEGGPVSPGTTDGSNWGSNGWNSGNWGWNNNWNNNWSGSLGTGGTSQGTGGSNQGTGSTTSGSVTLPGALGTIITVFPRPIIPCFFCNTTQYGTVRFLNAAAGYNPFLIYLNNQLVVNSLDNGEISQYGRVSAGRQTVTISGQNGYVFIQKQISITSGSALTVAIINTTNGLDLLVITDSTCQSGYGTGCFRAANLSVTNQSLNISLNNFINFQNVNYQDVTGFSYITTGSYTARVYNNPSLTGNALVTSSFSLRSNTAYTLYIFNWNQSRDAIRTLIVEDRS